MNTQTTLRTGWWKLGRRGVAAGAMVALAAQGAVATETLEDAGELAVAAAHGSARVMGMDAAYVGVADGADALQWNPAGLGLLKSAETGWHHLSGLDGAIGETVVVGIPLATLGGIALAGDFFDHGTFERRDDAGALQGEYGAGMVAGTLGWGRTFLDGIAAGAALRLSRQTLAGYVYESVAADVGVLWSAKPPLKVGLALANLGSSGSGNSLAMSIRAGASYALDLGTANKLLVAAAADIQPGGANAVDVGVEDTLLSLLAVRAGYRLALADQSLDGLTGVTAGAGLTWANLGVDYAFLPFGDLGTSHRISLTYRKKPEHAPHAESAEGGAK